MTDWGNNLVRTVLACVVGFALGLLVEHHWRAGKDAVAAAKVADGQVLAIEASVKSQAAKLQQQLAAEQERSALLLADQRARARATSALRLEITDAVFISPPDARGCTDPVGSPQFEQLYEAARKAGRNPAPAGSAAAR
ncbi:hypothetical protein [Dyella sp. 2RAB6]|uniref:hypothetical protein n=1 Tax=Dyella sp. 2RAB6 TaxID=3232992 RepID=UPI003F934B47